MKLINLNEAPIDNYELIGNWGDQEKSNSFADASDRRAVQSPKMQEKVYQKFGNTDHHLNFFFVNLPGMRKHSESGIMSPEDLAKNFPMVMDRIQEKSIETDEAINILFVSNTGFQKVKMTPWIMAHRIGHVMAASNRFGGEKMPSWTDYEKDFYDLVRGVLRDRYNWNLTMDKFRDSKALAKFYEAIGTMKSAVNGQLGGRPYEFVYEIFAQYITTGNIMFRELPMQFGIRNQGYYRYQVDEDDFKDYMTREQNIRDQIENDSWYYLNNGLGLALPDRIDNVLYSATGKFFVM